jgi:hypothetical protein
MNDLIDKLEALLHERAPLQALYGNFGTFDHTRKIILSAERDAERFAAANEGRKTTEAAIDDVARNAESYATLIARATAERTQLAHLDADITALEHRISYMRAQTYENAQLARMQ